METLIDIFGTGTELGPLQMAARAVVVFLFSLLLIRISGKRSFGMRMPVDNVVTILLGAVLSRAITGASPFFSTLAAGLAIIVMYRLITALTVYSRLFGRIVKGKVDLVYKDGKMLKETMNRCMVTQKDLEEVVRVKGQADSFEKIETMHVERNGEISVVKKSQ